MSGDVAAFGVGAPFPLPAQVFVPLPPPRAQREAILTVADLLDWAGLDHRHLTDHLMRLGRSDIVTARLAEGHIDALRILQEAGRTPVADAAYGVWASRSAGTGLTGTRVPQGWRLDGTLRFASGAGVLDRALVPVWTGPDEHVLLDLPVADWEVDSGAWQANAMAGSRSHTIRLDHCTVDGRQLGDPGFYLRRRGFQAGGILVAAVWVGCATRVVDLLDAGLAAFELSDCHRVRRGHLTAELGGAALTCRAAAAELDRTLGPCGAGAAQPPDLRPLATVTRFTVAGAARRALDQVRHLAGPAGLAHQPGLAQSVEDTFLYLAQQNVDGDAGYLSGRRG